MKDKTFFADLAKAQGIEHETGKLLESYGAKIVSYNNDSRWDIETVIKGETVCFEVKDESEVWKYGKVCLEYMSAGKDSGIRTTQAEWHIFKLGLSDGPVYLMVKTEKLRKAIEAGEFIKTASACDGKNKVYLFNLAKFMRLGKIL